MQTPRALNEQLLTALDKGLYLEDTHILLPTIKDLLQRGAQVNAQDKLGARPLDKALLLGSTELVKLLLENKADPNLSDFLGWTPLHTAANMADREFIKLLLEHGANTQVKDSKGRTPQLLLKNTPDYSFLGPASKKDLKALIKNYPLLHEAALKPTDGHIQQSVYFGLPHLVHAFVGSMPVKRLQEKGYVHLAREKYKETEDESYKKIGQLFRRRLGLSGPESGIAKEGLLAKTPLYEDILEYIGQFM